MGARSRCGGSADGLVALQRAVRDAGETSEGDDAATLAAASGRRSNDISIGNAAEGRVLPLPPMASLSLKIVVDVQDPLAVLKTAAIGSVMSRHRRCLRLATWRRP